METSLLILGTSQTVNLLVFGWVNRVFVSQPRWNHPEIFRSATACKLLCYSPLVVMVALVVCAFLYTHSPWLFLGLTVAGWVALSERPHSDLTH